MNIPNGVGVAVLVAGAVVTYASKSLAARTGKVQRNWLFKVVGLAAVIVGFVLIIFSPAK